MLQTELNKKSNTRNRKVSSPQGNATNKMRAYKKKILKRSFKSPRECYKHFSHLKKRIRDRCFKSPRECYKPFLTMIFSSLHAGFKSPRECYKLSSPPFFPPKLIIFKSPRECYKPYAVPRVMGTAIQFQVPKGMLQTTPRDTPGSTFILCFKSPRECYKREVVKKFRCIQTSFGFSNSIHFYSFYWAGSEIGSEREKENITVKTY